MKFKATAADIDAVQASKAVLIVADTNLIAYFCHPRANFGTGGSGFCSGPGLGGAVVVAVGISRSTLAKYFRHTRA